MSSSADQHRDPHPEPRDDVQEADLVRAREVLERTVRFLSHCAKDPKAALEADDPRALVQALESIVPRPAEAPATEPAKEPRTIPIRRRRSA